MAVTSGFTLMLPAVDVRPFFICGKGLMRGKRSQGFQMRVKNLRKITITIFNKALDSYKLGKKGYKLFCIRVLIDAESRY